MTYATDDDMYDALAGTWAESSYQMHVLAQGRGTRYFHFLQPNQYLEGTKPMGDEERRIAILESHPYLRSVKLGYPRLQDLGRELRSRGVDFVDLTRVFADNLDVLYRDNCCHLNEDGRRLVMAAIGEAISNALTGQRD